MKMDIQKALQKVKSKIDELTKMIDKLTVETDIQKSVKKQPSQKSVSKKTDKTTAADTVLAIIKRSKKGIDTAGIMQKTGFNASHIHNIVSILKKDGKVKSEKRGTYIIS
jgi:hypothetical protein